MLEFYVFCCSFLILLLVVEVAYRMGKRWRRHKKEAALEIPHLDRLQTALFGLMSLLLGFDFSMSISRFDTRKNLLQAETDAIGGIALQAQFLPSEDRQRIMSLLKKYTESRIAYSQAGEDRAATTTASTESSELRRQLWADVRGMDAANHSTTADSMLFPALNTMESAAWKRRAALDDHVPFSVLLLLISVASGALGFLAFNAGLTGPRRHISTSIFIFMISAVLFTIVDLDHPRSGLIKVSNESLIRIRGALDGMD